jgi:hypothetical protein
MQEAKRHRAQVEQKRTEVRNAAQANLNAGVAKQSSSGSSGASTALGSIAAVCAMVALVVVIRAKRQRSSSSTAVESQL